MAGLPPRPMSAGGRRAGSGKLIAQCPHSQRPASATVRQGVATHLACPHPCAWSVGTQPRGMQEMPSAPPAQLPGRRPVSARERRPICPASATAAERPSRPGTAGSRAVWLQWLRAAGVVVTSSVVEKLKELPEDQASYLVHGAIAMRRFEDAPSSDLGSILGAATCATLSPSISSGKADGDQESGRSPSKGRQSTGDANGFWQTDALDSSARWWQCTVEDEPDKVYVMPLCDKNRMKREFDVETAAAMKDIGDIAAWANTRESKERPNYAVICRSSKVQAETGGRHPMQEGTPLRSPRRKGTSRKKPTRMVLGAHWNPSCTWENL